MKRFIIFMFILSCISFVYAQETTDNYRSFIEEGKMWISYENNLICPISELRGQFVRRDFFDGDTLVAGRQCKRWIQQFTRIGEDQPAFHFTVPTYEENKRVWFFMEGEPAQKLMFDFGASVGDEFTIEPPDALLWKVIGRADEEGLLASEENVWKSLYLRSVCVFAQKDSILEQRSYRMTGISGYTDNHAGSNWVLEGIGSCSRPDWIFDYSDAFYSSTLIYCTVGDEVLYFDESAAKYHQIPLPTSISTPQTVNGRWSNSKWSDGRCFDLSGRPVLRATRGFYITGGKKYLAK